MLTHSRPPTLVALLLGAVLAASPALAQETLPQPPQAAPATGYVDLARPLIPAVVNISATQATTADQPEAPPDAQPPQQQEPRSPFEDFFRDFFGPRQQAPDGESRRRTAVGSGFIIDPAGYIVTNNHVIENAESISVILHDESEHTAQIVGTDPRSDLALLRIETTDELPAVRWGDSDASEIGESVLAIGNPFGLGGSVTAGIISARARDLGVGPYDEFLQTDASINRGNSGGPLFNMRGEVIGVTTAIFSPTGANIGIGFAIPAVLAQTVIRQLRDTGEVRRGWIGVRIQRMNQELAGTLDLDSPSGALVVEVTPGAPADEAQIQVGDVILQFDGQAIDNETRLPRVVADTEIGTTVPVTVWREGQNQSLQLTVADMSEAPGMTEPDPAPEPEPEPETRPELGLSLAPLTERARRTFEIPADVNGVAVANVEAGSASAERDIRPGDIIIRVGRDPVSKPQEVATAISQAIDGGRDSILLLLRRGEQSRFVSVPLPARG